MKNILINATLIILCFLCYAQPIHAQKHNEAERENWIKELRNYKHSFLTESLSLTQEQENEFFPLYDEMEREIMNLHDKTRELEKQINDNKDASDIEIENAARTIFELKRAEGQIEMTYFEKLKKILEPRQLLMLKKSEHKFTRKLMKHHRKMQHSHEKDSK